jgi:hypothetical protein
MASNPVRRARREAQEAAARKSEALRIAAADGAAAASRATGVGASTIRSWMTRERAKAASAASESLPVEQLAGGGALDSMRRARDSHRRVEAQAVAATERALRGKDESAARNAATASGIASDKALALDRAILAAEAEEETQATRLGREALELQAAVLRAVFVALDVPPPVELLTLLAQRAGLGEPLQLPEDVVARARETVAAPVRARVLSELEAERARESREREGESEGAGGEDADDGDGEPEGGRQVSAPWPPPGGTRGQERQAAAGEATVGSWERPGDPPIDGGRAVEERPLATSLGAPTAGHSISLDANRREHLRDESAPRRTGRVPRPPSWKDEAFGIGQAG